MTPTPEPLSALCDRIEALAEKATRGPWEARQYHESAAVVAQKGRWTVAECGPSRHPASEADAAYLAALDPSTLLRLVAAVRAGETGEPLANAFKWLMDTHVLPALRADLNVLSVLDVRVLAREYAATLGRESSPAPPAREERCGHAACRNREWCDVLPGTPGGTGKAKGEGR